MRVRAFISLGWEVWQERCRDDQSRGQRCLVVLGGESDNYEHQFPHSTTLHSDPPPPTGGVKSFHWVLATIVSSVEVHVKLAKRFWWEVPGPEMETAGRKRVLFSDNTPLLSLSCDSQSQRQFINSEILPFWPNNVNWLTQYLAPPGDREGEGGTINGSVGYPVCTRHPQ